MMDIRRAAALLLALVMIAALTVGCGKSRVTPPRIHPLPVRTSGLPPSSRRSWCATTGR